MKKNSFKQLLRYLITGVTAFGLEYGLYVMLLKVWHIHYLLSSALVYTILFWIVFIVNRKWSFESKGEIKRQLLCYGILFAFNLVIGNVFLMKFLTHTMGFSPYFSPFLKMACIVSWNFLIYKYIIYK